MTVFKAVWPQGELRVFLLPANFELDRMTSHKHSLAAKYSFRMVVSKVEFWASFETNFFRIAGTSEAETLVSGKTHFLAIGGDKKVLLFGVTLSINTVMTSTFFSYSIIQEWATL